MENNAAYIQHWLGHLKNDKRFIVYASSQAQKATDYILNVRNEERELGMDENSIPKYQERAEQIKDLRGKDNSDKGMEIEM